MLMYLLTQVDKFHVILYQIGYGNPEGFLYVKTEFALSKFIYYIIILKKDIKRL